MKIKFRRLVPCIIVLSMIFSLLGASYISTAADTDPVLHLKFNGDFKDSSGNGYDGTKVGKIEFVEKGPIGQAAEFKGGYLELNNTGNLNLSKNFTLSAWIRLSADTTDGEFPMFFKPSQDDPDYAIDYFGLGYGRTVMCAAVNRADSEGNGSGDLMYYSNGLESSMMTEKWSLLTYTYNNGETSFFFDGQQIASEKEDNQTLADYPNMMVSNEKVRIGFYGGGSSYLKGFIDDMRLYNYTMTAEQVEAVYNEIPHKDKKMILQIDNPMMEVNGENISIDGDRGTTPIIDTQSRRTLLPIRAVVEAMGGTIAWDNADKRVDVNCKGKVLKLWIGKKTAIVSGETKTLDVFPKIINGRTMMPLRFIAESLDAEVLWDGDLQKITVLYN